MRQTEKLHELEKYSLDHCCCSSVAKSDSLDPMDCSTPISSVVHCLPELLIFMSIELVMLSNHLIIATQFSFCIQSSPALRSFARTSHHMAKVLEL